MSKRILLKKLLDIDDRYMALNGLSFSKEYIAEEEINDPNFKFDIEKKEDKLEKQKKLQKFVVKRTRDDRFDSLEPPNEFLPSIPFAMYILGVVKAGKSTFLENIIDVYIENFDEVIFISPTIKLCPSAKHIIERYDITKTFKRLKVLEKYIQEATKVNECKEPRDKIKTLIILDDVINQICRHARKEDSFLNTMMTNRRHLGFSIILLSQYFVRAPPIFRTNFDAFVLFRTENQKERKKIVEELSGALGMKAFEKLFLETTKEPFSFLSVNFDAKGIHQFTKNFNELIITEQDLKQQILNFE